MAILTKGQTFANADSVTSTKLNNLVDAAAFVAGASGSTDDSSLEVNGGGRLQVKDSGVTSAKIAASAVTTSKLPNSTLSTDGVTYAKVQRVANMKALGNVSGSLGVVSEVSILDEDNMVSDSATALATQQSIKAYVDSSFVAGTAVASTSGTSIDFTGIPSTAKRVTVNFSGVSTNGTSTVIIQLGDSGGIESTGYFSHGAGLSGPGVGSTDYTTGFGTSNDWSAAYVFSGSYTLSLLDPSTNNWVLSGISRKGTTGLGFAAGNKPLSATLDRIRVTTVGGANTFDAGMINIMYE